MKKSEFVLIAVVVLAVWFAWALQPLYLPTVLNSLGFDWSFAQAGEWGDAFGALNALVAAFAFVGVIATLRLQAADLRSQQEQLAEAQNEQYRQRFESYFFQLLDLLNTLRSRVSTDDGEINVPKDSLTTIYGFDAIDMAAKNINHTVLGFGLSVKGRNGGELLDSVKHAFSVEYEVLKRVDAGPYIRLLSDILRRVKDDPKLLPQEKDEYLRLLRNQLTSSDVIFLGTVALIPLKSELRKSLDELGMLRYAVGPARDMLVIHYSKSAFASYEPSDTHAF